MRRAVGTVGRLLGGRILLAASLALPVGASATDARQSFFDALGDLCGAAYEGRVVADEPPSADDPFRGKVLVMHVRECTDEVIRVPFHVGEDRSRTWVITRLPEGLRLKHDHRHEDGSSDELTMYGGDTRTEGSARRQEFPVDAESIALFERTGRNVSTTNTWALELEPGALFVYELARPGGRLFRVEFDLSRQVEPPPAPWGAEAR
jgi:hypothetical protein